MTYSPNDIEENGVRVLRSSNINEDQFVLSDDDVFVKRKAIKIDYVENGDILITSANGSPRLVGKHAKICNIDKNSTVHGGFMLIAKTQQPDFLNASMSSCWYKTFLRLHVAGGNGAIGNLNANELGNYKFMIPNEPEQIKLGTLFQKIETLITLHQRGTIYLMI